MCHPLRRMVWIPWRQVELEVEVAELRKKHLFMKLSLLLQAFAQNVLSKADVIQATGDAICIFRELQCLTPRGRYDIRIYPTFLHLHGKTFDYKIPYTTVLRLFLLPHKDQRQMFFVVRNFGIIVKIFVTRSNCCVCFSEQVAFKNPWCFVSEASCLNSVYLI